MKTLIKSIFFLALAMITISGTGQNKKAEQILEEVTEKIRSHNSVDVHFSYILKDADNKTTEEGSGELLINNEKYRLTIIGQQVYCDGETIWTYIEDAEEVQINAVTEEEGMISPSNILTFYNDKYKAKSFKEDKYQEKEAFIIELKPNEDKHYSSVDFYIDKEETEILKIILHDKNGGSTEYIIDKMDWDVPVTAKDFVFDTTGNPDLEVIDMR